MDKATQLINDLTEYLIEKEQRYQQLSWRIGELENSGADPVDPPADPVDPTGEISIFSKGSLTPGTSGVFEATMEGVDLKEVDKVEFFVNDQFENTEKNSPFESWPTIPDSDFTVSVVFTLDDGGVASGTQSFVVEAAAPPADPVVGTPPSEVSVEAYDQFVDEADGQWFGWKGSDLSLGAYNGEALKTLYNGQDQKTGNPSTRAVVEDVPEFGGVRMMNVFGNQNSSNFSNRLAIPKSGEYQPGSQVAIKMVKGYLKHNQTGNASVDRRTYKPFHWKGYGIQPVGGPPPSGNTVGNPVQAAGKCEFVLNSHYSFNAIKGTNKGDQTAVELGQPTSYGSAVLANPGAYYFEQVGLYAHDVTDYKYQSQIFPTVPDADGNMTTERLAFNYGEVYQHFFIIKGNTFVNGVDQKDGEFIWILQNDNLNGGEPFVTAKLTNRSFTIGQPVQFARGGMGMYINPGDQKPSGMHYGFFIGEHSTHYKA